MQRERRPPGQRDDVKSRGGDAAPGDVAGRPRPLEVEPADPAVDVEHFARRRYSPGQTRDAIVAGSISVERDAAGRRLGEVVAARVDDRQRPFDERARQTPPLGVAREVRERRRCRRSPRRREQRRGDRRRHHRGERRLHRRSRALPRPTRSSPRRRRRTVAPGQKLTVIGDTVALDLRAQPVARRVQGDRAADAEMRPEQRAAQADVGSRPSIQTVELDVVSDTPDSSRVKSTPFEQDSGASAGVGRHDRVAEAPGDARSRRRRCRSSAATGRRSRGRPRLARQVAVPVVTMRNRRSRIRARDVEHAMAGLERRAGAVGFAQQRVEHVARAIGVGKQLAAGLLVEADADLAEERDGGTRPETRGGRGGRSTGVRPRSRAR